MGYRVARHGNDLLATASHPSAPLPLPAAVPTPPGAEGWQDLYSYSLPFSDDRKEYEESAFWFRETIHWPRPLRPFEATFLQDAIASLGQFNHRHYVVPAARGLDVRILNGYCYLSPGSIDDVDEIADRAEMFDERGGFYYRHWDELYAVWMDRIRDLLARLDAITFAPLPDVVPLGDVVGGRGLGSVYDLPRTFHHLLDLAVELWQRHFEFLNLGYGAYLDYFGFCRSVFPEIGDLEVARMVAGIDVDLFRPDQELRRLARAAIDLGVAEVLCAGTVEGVVGRLVGIAGGEEWLADFTRTQQPWFNFSTGSGFYHDDAVWADQLEYPLGFIRSYIAQLREGHAIDAPSQRVADERDDLARRARSRLTGNDRQRFDEKLQLARTVFHFVENHNFYVEHWGMSLVWRKLRELSSVFVKEGFWSSTSDMFFLRSDEVEASLWDMLGSWANGTPARGPQRWPREILRRRAILAACEASCPPPVLGVMPQSLTEPFTIMLWGITTDSIAAGEAATLGVTELRGFAASGGLVIGRARVVLSADKLDEVEDGEILVTELTSPSWAPVFGRIAGTVTETGGMMSHVAIVCREYGLPAVAGVAHATQCIRTGQLLSVDGSNGIVTILD
ncbi:MAG: PEP-utilizing enzyme [Actinomycetota bacterium]|nr:PEP-utilizing enzyme [Actinomycetota bacterium]